ncbi:phage tail sheath family protein [Echinicola sp. CAU 1574]|uniref:Phage tail sheath family protein n=1 Tax=Echinicola arenosa TaxID=2774144 RepID=A0ABR9AMZ8_9BACT|nr:phage tail sheath C-terminal domain-containing protein [Echinicola arenosa]MBD8489275.1 phage tail sheath family protein [Echinicola arenosa]
MATSYKTPGVYVEEISIFPPSVAQVETAIPAFIGYTKMAKETISDDLLNVPTKISSVLEFVQYYGGAPDIDITSIELDASNQVTSILMDDKYYMYECIRMFYANGGGDCYITAVGKYGETPQNGDGITAGFIKGLNEIKKVDEPTILLAPDAVLMSQSNMNSLHQAMLAQCNELKDRFSIFDLKENTGSHDDAADNFRNGIGINYLKYGAAYSPWLKANLPRAVNYKDIKDNLVSGGGSVDLADLVADPEGKDLANRLDNLVDDQLAITAEKESLHAGFNSYESKYESLSTTLSTNPSKANLEALLNYYVQCIDFVRDTIEVGTDVSISLSDVSTPAGDTEYLFDYLVSKLTGSLDTTITALQDIYADSADAGSTLTAPPLNLPAPSPTGVDYTTGGTANGDYFTTGSTNIESITPNISDFIGLWTNIKSAMDLIVTSADNYVSTLQESAVEAIPPLKNIIRAISNELLTLPPSGTMAGVYARVDNDRGVWKAPANVSLNNVVGVKTLIDNKKQEGFNVDVVAGKSINIIRPFTGKGILVWGARTLAGNDNEWRYVSVRRFFNMVEESVKKTTEQFVFESNDANTWVKVRAMIENFLILQWRAGALQGAKPEQAFFVRVGLGQTMTALDILEGRMNVEIGMAVVRPAEFIILKFSHKMPEA